MTSGGTSSSARNFCTPAISRSTDPYSWTANGQPWINHEIIAEVALALAHRALGGTGLLLLKMIVGLLTFGIALSIARKQMSPGARLIAWAFGALAVVEISYGFAPRPQIFTALALAAELWILAAIHRGHWRWAFALPPLFAVWINTHGGALAGIILLFVATIATALQSFCSRFAPDISPRAHRRACARQRHHAAGNFQRGFGRGPAYQSLWF